jgi:hypothetical protein
LEFKKPIRKKNELVEVIVKRPPMAKAQVQRKSPLLNIPSTNSDAALKTQLHALKKRLDLLRSQLMQDSGKPEFAEVYRRNYGLQYRMNSNIYEFFKPSRSKGTYSKYI